MQLQKIICLDIKKSFSASYEQTLQFVDNYLNGYQATTCLTSLVIQNNQNKFENRKAFSLIVSNVMAELQFLNSMCLNITSKDENEVYASNENFQFALMNTIPFVKQQVFKPEYDAMYVFEDFLEHLLDRKIEACDATSISIMLNQTAYNIFSLDIPIVIMVATNDVEIASLNCNKPTCLIKQNLYSYCSAAAPQNIVEFSFMFTLYRGGHKTAEANVTKKIADDYLSRQAIIYDALDTQTSMQKLTNDLHAHIEANHIADIYKSINTMKVDNNPEHFHSFGTGQEYYFLDGYRYNGCGLYVFFYIP